MLVRIIPVFLAVASLLSILSFSTAAEASEPTEVLDGTGLMDTSPSTFNTRGFAQEPYFYVTPGFRFDYTTAEISREAPCVASENSFEDGELAANNPRVQFDEQGCSTPRIVNRRQMDYRSTRTTLDMTLRTGARGIELRLNFPLVLSSSRGLRYAQAQRSATESPVNENNSFVDPSDQRIRNHGEDVFSDNTDRFSNELDQFQMYRFMELSSEFSPYDRSGFADPTVGVHWAPWSDYDDDTKATMHVGVDYTMPVARAQQAGNTSVGRGVHELTWSVGASKKFDWIEPYFGAQYTLPMARSNSLFGEVDPRGDFGQGQVVQRPPMHALFSIGTELIPYENPAQGARYSLDLSFNFGYTSEGRDYSPLFDHMTDPGNRCNGMTLDEVRPQFDGDTLTNPEDVACAWVVQQPSNSTGNAEYDLNTTAGDRSFEFTDLMTVDSYGTFGLELGANLQPHHLFQFRVNGGITHHQAHLLTNARTGSTGGEGAVTMDDGTERNPTYNPAYDNSGDRFRVTRYNTWHVAVGTALQF